MLAATLAPDGTVLEANPALERLAGGRLGGSAFDELIQTAQRDAFARRLAAAGGPVGGRPRSRSPASGAETATDRRVWLRRAGDAVLLVAEPAVGEQEHLVEKVLELNDELVVAHRELVRQREELRAAADRIHNLEAISAAGLVNLRLDDLLDEVLRIIAEAVGSERAVLLLLDGGRARRARGRRARRASSSTRSACRSASGVAGGIAQENAPRVIPDLSQGRGPQRLPARELALDGGRAADARRRGDRRPARLLGRARPLRRGRPRAARAGRRARRAGDRARAGRRAGAADRRDAAARPAAGVAAHDRGPRAGGALHAGRGRRGRRRLVRRAAAALAASWRS